MSNSRKILIIDDEPDILEFLSYNFRKNGFTVLLAGNGAEGIVKAESELPGIIVSDILMPVMDGIEMCTRIRKNEKLKSTPFIFLTAVIDDYKILYAMTSGANQYASKPIKFEYLLTLVNKLLEGRAA